MEPGLVVAGKYHVVRLVAEGGMGAVYDAIHAKTGRRVALKLIHEQVLAKGPTAIRRFAREAKAAGAIDSSHVVQVLDAGEDDASGMPFLAMEYLEGEDLRRVLRRGPLPEERALAIAVEACLGLVAAHAAEVVHRDLKPANLFLAETGDGRQVVKILDFGIAKVIEDDDDGSRAALTTTGDIVGSPMYMSPEQLASPRDVDHRTDLWSLGVVLYEMLSGAVPTADVQAIGARVYAICHVPAASLTERAAGTRAEVAALVARALALDPAARFASAEEMLAALRAVQGRAVEKASADAETQAEAPAAARAPARRRAWAVGGTALSGVAIAIAIAFAVGARPAHDATVPPVAEARAAAVAAAAVTAEPAVTSAAPTVIDTAGSGTAGTGAAVRATSSSPPSTASTPSTAGGVRRAAGNARATIVVPDARPRASTPRPVSAASTGREHL